MNALPVQGRVRSAAGNNQVARRRQSVTIKHVAADAGVSLQTVSRVINNEANVRPAMKERVQASIDRLGYVPSIAAQRMSGSRSYLILSINDRDRTVADWRAREGSDWVAQMLLGGMLTCAEHGYRLMIELVDTHDDHIERGLQAALSALRPDGVILTPPFSDDPRILSLLEKRDVPFVRIGAGGAPGGIRITMNDYGSAREATRYLADLGHARIAFITGSKEYSLAHRRREGWSDAMTELGLDTAGLERGGDFSRASGARAARELLSLDNRPTAIVASNDQMAFGVMEVAQERGLAIPEDLSLISFDNSPMTRFTSPQITAIDQPIAETAARAIEMLMVARDPDATIPDGPVNIPGRLIERGSTAAPPVGSD